MNLLFTCAGRRNYLLEYFQNALNGQGQVLAADMQITAPAMACADKAIVVPHVYAPNYVDSILEICRKEKVRGLFSLNDLELPVLASEKRRFDDIGVRLVVSDEDVIDICFDKCRTMSFCEQTSIAFPRTYLTMEEASSALKDAGLEFPLVVKPRWGSASMGIEYSQNMEELDVTYQLGKLRISDGMLAKASSGNPDRAIMIQEKLSGREYGVDILNDLSGRTVQVYVKEKLAMRSGETDKAVLRDNPVLEKMGFQIGEKLRHIGNMDCDVFEHNGEYYLLELNPRFGGGYPFSHMAGADYPSAICAWLNDESYDFSKFSREYDVPFAKCDTLIEVGREE